MLDAGSAHEDGVVVQSRGLCDDDVRVGVEGERSGEGAGGAVEGDDEYVGLCAQKYDRVADLGAGAGNGLGSLGLGWGEGSVGSRKGDPTMQHDLQG